MRISRVIGSVFAGVFLTVALSTASCGGNKGRSGGGGPKEVEGPDYGKGDGTAEADFESCSSVLREIVWAEDSETAQVFVDVANIELDAGATPRLIFSFDVVADGAGGQNFFDAGEGVLVQASQVEEGKRPPLTGDPNKSFSRFKFEVDVQGNNAFEVIPFISRADNPDEPGPGDELYDHNRDPDGEQGVRPNVKGRGQSNYVARRGAGIFYDGDTCPQVKCADPALDAVQAFEGVALRDPVDMIFHNDRVLFVEKLGRVLSCPNDPAGATTGDCDVFLDWQNAGRAVRDELKTYTRGVVNDRDYGDNAPGWEEGFLSLAKIPGQAAFMAVVNSGNGQPTADNEIRWNLLRFECEDENCRRLSEDADDVTVMISYVKAGLTHNAGAIVFDPDPPNDPVTGNPMTIAFVASGSDGLFPFDPRGFALNPADLRGTIMRLDVNPDNFESDAEREFMHRVPNDNPFVNEGPGEGAAADPRVFVYGVRNPWRISFDAASRTLIGAEVGENAREEINIYEPGKNYGFPFWEANQCTDNRGTRVGCPKEGRQFPIAETFASGSQLPAGQFLGDSITGGFIVRGGAYEDLEGHYIFGDFIQGTVLSVPPENIVQPPEGNNDARPAPKLLAETGRAIAAFAQDPSTGAIYLIHHAHREGNVDQRNRDDERADGEVYVLEAASCKSGPPETVPSYAFLAADGQATERTARAYYRSILPEDQSVDDDTLRKWKIRQGITDEDGTLLVETADSLYHNCWDLCFWREMHCTTDIGPGRGGCWVTNYTEEEQSPLGAGFEPGPGASDLGTVTMHVAVPADETKAPFTAFSVYLDQGRTDVAFDASDPTMDTRRNLNLFAILDDEKGDGITEDDKKFVPNLCTTCHGGFAYRFNGDPDIGATFREFDLELMSLEVGGNFPKERLEEVFLPLNEAALSADLAIGATGANMVKFLTEELYPQSGAGATSLVGQQSDVFDPTVIPESWTEIDERDLAALENAADPEAAKDEYEEAKLTLWNDFVNPVCMTCHRLRKAELSPVDYPFFRTLGELKDGGRALDGFITGDPTDLEGHPPFMPHTQNLFDRINGVRCADGVNRSKTKSGDAAEDLQPDNGAGCGNSRWEPEVGVRAKESIVEWYAALDGLQAAQCEVTFRVRTDATEFGEEIFVTGEVIDGGEEAAGRLGTWAPWKGLQLSGEDFPDWSGTVSLPDGATVEWKPVVVDERESGKAACNGEHNTLVKWAAGENRRFVIECGADGTAQTPIDVEPLFQNAACQN